MYRNVIFTTVVDFHNIVSKLVSASLSLNVSLSSLNVSFLNASLSYRVSTDSVRLVNGSGRCSGRLEIHSNQSWWSVCEEDLDRNDAQVVCRELGCGAPGLLQGGLYGDGEAPVWTSELQCEGNESKVLDCNRSSSAGKTCSSGTAAGLTCTGTKGVEL